MSQKHINKGKRPLREVTDDFDIIPPPPNRIRTEQSIASTSQSVNSILKVSHTKPTYITSQMALLMPIESDSIKELKELGEFTLLEEEVKFLELQ